MKIGDKVKVTNKDLVFKPIIGRDNDIDKFIKRYTLQNYIKFVNPQIYGQFFEKSIIDLKIWTIKFINYKHPLILPNNEEVYKVILVNSEREYVAAWSDGIEVIE